MLGARESEFAGFAQLVFVDETLDARSDWYVAELDQTFSSDSVASGVQERWGNDFGEQQTLDVRFGEDVLFGVNTGIYFREDNGMLVPRRDIFGWIQLRVDADYNVAMIDNAMAFESGQIIIGRNLIPEPRANLFTVLLVGLLLRR